MNEVASVAEKLDRSRHDVLNLTLRNPLLNFRVLRAKGLKIIDEIPQEVYRILVREGRGMYFEAADRDGESGSLDDDQGVPEELLTLMTEAEGEDDPDELAMRHADNKLQTPYERVRLGTRLRNTYRHTHLSIEEQGVNIRQQGGVAEAGDGPAVVCGERGRGVDFAEAHPVDLAPALAFPARAPAVPLHHRAPAWHRAHGDHSPVRPIADAVKK